MFISIYGAPTLQQASVQVFGGNGDTKRRRTLSMAWKSSMSNFTGIRVDIQSNYNI